MSEDERRAWLRSLAPDDAADLIQEAPRRDRVSFLAALDPWPRAEVSAPLAYKEDEAGGLMNLRFARLRPEMEMDEAIAYLRRQAGQVETIYEAYGLDSDQWLLGVASLRELLSAPRSQQVRNVMRTRFQKVRADAHQEALAKLIADHRLLALPAVDRIGTMQGIVTIDDAMQASREGAGRDLQKLCGMEALETAYLETNLGKLLRKRAGWLSVLFIDSAVSADDAQTILEKISSLHRRALAAADSASSPERSQALRQFAGNLDKAFYGFEPDFFHQNLLRIVGDVIDVIRASIQLWPSLVEICYFQKKRRGLPSIRVRNHSKQVHDRAV
jgi:Mg/Co/Ni transporter MgtE